VVEEDLFTFLLAGIDFTKGVVMLEINWIGVVRMNIKIRCTTLFSFLPDPPAKK